MTSYCTQPTQRDQSQHCSSSLTALEGCPKSNVCLLSSWISNKLTSVGVFTWAQSRFQCLRAGCVSYTVHIFHINYDPLLKMVMEELEHWNLLSVSFLRWIKMNILPRFSYLFQSLRWYLDHTWFKSINNLTSSFIWKSSSPRTTQKPLTVSKDNSGLGLPDLQVYCWVAQTNSLMSWAQNHRTAHWTFQD